MTMRFPGAPEFRPDRDTLVIALDFFDLTIEPEQWISNRVRNPHLPLVRSSVVYKAPAKNPNVIVRVNPFRQTLSLIVRKVNLVEPGSTMPAQTAGGLGYGDFVRVNEILLREKETRRGKKLFRY